MKTVKQYDLLISAALFLIFLVLSLSKRDGTFIYGYLVVGGWQVISMIVHAFGGWFTNWGSKRYYYHRIVAVIISIALLSFAIPVFWFIYYALLFAAAPMAMYYMLICWYEIDFLRKREFIHLKN